ncbi:MAG: hypothetical protein H5U17_07515 [Defluviimonas sp.]|nr:hypothetical protein [Defluviimonas sp.]
MADVRAVVLDAFGCQRFRQRRRGAGGDEPFEDHPDRRGLVFIDYSLRSRTS